MLTTNAGRILDSSQQYYVIDISDLKACLCYRVVSNARNRYCTRIQLTGHQHLQGAKYVLPPLVTSERACAETCVIHQSKERLNLVL